MKTTNSQKMYLAHLASKALERLDSQTRGVVLGYFALESAEKSPKQRRRRIAARTAVAKTTPRRRKLSAAVRAKLSVAAKRRWANAKKAKAS